MIDKKDRDTYLKVSSGVKKWVSMMVRRGELKIGDDKIIDGDTFYGWTGEDEIESSILGFIFDDI